VDLNTLIEELQLTKGNLSTHVLKLEEKGLMSVKKEFVGRKPRTTYSCTPQGRREMEDYLSRIETLLKQTK